MLNTSNSNSKEFTGFSSLQSLLGNAIWKCMVIFIQMCRAWDVWNIEMLDGGEIWDQRREDEDVNCEYSSECRALIS